MAKTSQAAAYDEATVYVVKLMRPVMYGKAKFLPLNEVEMTGRVLNAVVKENGADAIDSATPKE